MLDSKSKRNLRKTVEGVSRQPGIPKIETPFPTRDGAPVAVNDELVFLPLSEGDHGYDSTKPLFRLVNVPRHLQDRRLNRGNLVLKNDVVADGKQIEEIRALDDAMHRDGGESGGRVHERGTRRTIEVKTKE